VAAWAYNISGTITDTAGEPLPDATVRLLQQRDSAFVKGVIADSKGNFSFTGVDKGHYIVEANYIGYNKLHKSVNVTNSNMRLGTLQVGESSVMLKEATVTGVKTPIRVMQDTIEFNADTYKTPPNAVVEDLLKRLPGVEVDSSGKITANGKEVSKILVDGKEFFSDDPKVASKNLPVNMVDKLQVVDRKSDLARLTGVDDGEDETVINLTVKKGMKNGWFGTIEGGYGTDDRYQATFNVNRFWNDNQLTFIGSANNTNDLGFTDGNGNRFRRFGGDEGINNSQQFGVNFNVGNGEILRVGGDVMYSHTDRDTRKRQETQYLFANDPSYEKSNSIANDRGHNVRADFRVEWKPDSFNSVDFRPNFSYNQNNSTSTSTDYTFGARQVNGVNVFDDPVNTAINNADSRGTSWEAGARLIYNHNFAAKRGRSFSVMMDYSFSNVRERENSFAYTFYNKLNSNLSQEEQEAQEEEEDNDIETYKQYTTNHTWANNVSGRLSWTEPIGNVKNGNFITASYRVQYRWNNADKIVNRADVDLATNPIANPDDPNINTFTFLPWEYQADLSNQFRNDYMTQDIRLGYKKVGAKYNLDAGASAVPSMSKSIDLINSAKNIPERWVWNFAPFLRFRYRFDKQSSFNLHYMGRSSQPSMTQLQPVADYSNPLNVVQGNPNLKPSFSHNIRLRLQKFSPESQSSIMMMADAQITQNAIVNRTIYDGTTGGRYTTYENVNGVWNARVMNMYSIPFGRSKTWSFNNNVFVNYNQQQGYNNGLQNRSATFTIAETPALAFRPESLELEIRPLWRMQATFNSLENVANTTIHNYGGSFNGSWYAPLGLVLATDLTYTASSGYSAGYNVNQWMWNASISYQFLRDKSATISIKAYDLLKQKSNIQRTITANSISDVEYNSLTRYFMCTLTYKFNSFGKGNEPEDRNRRGGPDGGPGGRGPGGPPPGMRH
jgi:hypothetical protein